MEGLGVDCVGINCGLGPAQIGEMMTDLAEISSIPIMAQPNAGLPQIENGKTVYNVLPEQFADECEHMAKLGASVLGGCCGTTPDHIRSLVEKCKNYKPIVEGKKHHCRCVIFKNGYTRERSCNCRRTYQSNR